jgi:hypothetical protein
MSISVVSGFGPNLNVEMRPIALFIVLRSSIGLPQCPIRRVCGSLLLVSPTGEIWQDPSPILVQVRTLRASTSRSKTPSSACSPKFRSCSLESAAPDDSLHRVFCTTNAEVALRDALFSENHCCEYDTLRSHAVANTKREPDMPVTNLTYFQ